MDEREEAGMDTTYVGIMVVVFLVIAALAIDIGYLYVDEEDLQSAAETSALAGAEAIKQRIQAQVATDPSRLDDVVDDRVQAAARIAAIESTSGQHNAAALIEIANNNTNKLTTENDVTVGFWNVSTHAYIPGGTPVNAFQARTRRTAESDSVGLGSLGAILSRISAPQKLNYTPEAIAAFPARADASFALCVEACDPGCTYPEVCSIAERKLIRDSAPGKETPARNRYMYTTLSYPPTDATKLSDLVCMEMPPQEVCGRQVYTIGNADDNALRDMESMMYNPNVDKSNKDYDRKTGKLTGWWVIAPVTDCSPVRQDGRLEHRTVLKYALVRISRICVPGTTGCKQNDTSFDAPASACGDETGLYIDRISCLGCGAAAMTRFPGLHPVLVK